MISIIVPVYNSEKYLIKCIDSIRNHTINDIEILLINDGSTDNSAEICDDLSRIDKRIKTIHINNGGAANARNIGIKNATGEYIMFLIVSGFIVFGRPFIQYYAGNGYEDAYFVAVIMMIPCIVPHIQSGFLSATIAKNKHKFRSIVYFFIALLNLIGTWFLLHSYGITGAAFMTGVSFIIGHGLIMNVYYSKFMRFNILKFWKSELKLFIIPFLMCIVSLLLSNIIDFYNLKNLILGIILYSIIYILLNYIFIMNDYEKSILITIINKIKE